MAYIAMIGREIERDGSAYWFLQLAFWDFYSAISNTWRRYAKKVSLSVIVLPGLSDILATDCPLHSTNFRTMLSGVYPICSMVNLYKSVSNKDLIIAITHPKFCNYQYE